MTLQLSIYLENARLNGESYVDAERRQVTVLFTDMVGFTSFSERAGEEAAFTLCAAYRS
jgi:class 3 adenylate cyclase